MGVGGGGGGGGSDAIAVMNSERPVLLQEFPFPVGSPRTKICAFRIRFVQALNGSISVTVLH